MKLLFIYKKRLGLKVWIHVFLRTILQEHTLREKCPDTDFFLVHIFPHLDWIRSISLYSVQMRENTDQKKLCIWTLFMQWQELIFFSCYLSLFLPWNFHISNWFFTWVEVNLEEKPSTGVNVFCKNIENVILSPMFSSD